MPYESMVRRVTPYTPGEQPDDPKVIKLNTNENPYPPAPAVERVLRRYGESAEILRRYPDPACESLRAALGDAYGIEPDRIFVGVGSDDVLAMSFLTFFNSDEPVLFADITYSFYDVWAELFRIPYEQIPLDEEFMIVPSDYSRPCGGVVLANPNAPTGVDRGLDAIEEIVAAHSECVVIVDEAYVDFGAKSALPLLEKYDNLLIVQTMSKSRSLAGSRIGYAFGSRQLISYMNDVKYSFNSYTMDRITLDIGVAALSDRDYFEETRQRVISSRERLADGLRELGFTVPESATNFLFVRPPDGDAKGLFEALRAEGIYVRYWDKPRISDRLRITIGTDEECDRLIEALQGYYRV